MKINKIIFLVIISLACINGFVFADVALEKEQSKAENTISETQDLEAADEVSEEDSFQASKGQPVIVNGDEVEFLAETNEVVAKGNVEIIYGETSLTCDEIIVNTQTKDAQAKGNVVLSMKEGKMRSDEMSYNFDTARGEMVNLRFEASPYFGEGTRGRKISESQIVLNNTYFTTSDWDDPEYRMVTRQMRIYWGDKIVAKNVLFLVGKTPVFYIPQFIHKLNEVRPRVRVVFGKDDDWGPFILTAWRYQFNDMIHGRLHLDLRDKMGFAWGVTNPYNTHKFGQGVFKSYYTNERRVGENYWWPWVDEEEENTDPIYRERYMFNLRHKWDISDQTNLILEYFKTSDASILKDYFENRYEKEMQQKSYLQVIHNFSDYGSLSFYMRKRTNRIYTVTEELPTIDYTATSIPLGNNFYFTTENQFANLNYKKASPTDVDEAHSRFDTYNRLTYNTKIAFIETSSYVGIRETFYSRDAEGNNWPSPRTIFYSGVDMSTKFYRIFDVYSDLFDINKMRHVIKPSIRFSYINEPTIQKEKLLQLDDIDDIVTGQSVTLELSNKFQTKRKDENNNTRSVDLLRFTVSSIYDFKTSRNDAGSFDDFIFDLELLPRDWLRIESDAAYDHVIDKFESANFDISIHPGDRFALGAGYRYDNDSGKQLTGQLSLRINPKWSFRVYEKYDFTDNEIQEQEFALTRDLHSWVLDTLVNFNDDKDISIIFVCRLKAFPDMAIEASQTYHPPKPEL